MRKARIVSFCLLIALLALPAAWATTSVERTEADMVREASIIVTGHCTNLQSQWVGRTLVTLATIQVAETLKGNAGSTVTVTLPGGVDSNRRIPVAMNFPSAPVILQKENVLLFLTPQELVAGSYSVVGFSQGKFTVAQDAQGRKIASQDLSALNLRGKAPGGNGANNSRHGAAKTIQIDELRQRIREAQGVERQQR